MTTDDSKKTIATLLEGPLTDEGCELAEIIISRYRNNATLRLFVYSKNGTTINECARLSRIIGGIIDATDLFESGYALEVSSPGLDRPLRAAIDFKYRIGETVRLEFVDPKRSGITAEIIDAGDNEVKFRNETGAFAVDTVEIEQAKIIF